MNSEGLVNSLLELVIWRISGIDGEEIVWLGSEPPDVTESKTVLSDSLESLVNSSASNVVNGIDDSVELTTESWSGWGGISNIVLEGGDSGWVILSCCDQHIDLILLIQYDNGQVGKGSLKELNIFASKVASTTTGRNDRWDHRWNDNFSTVYENSAVALSEVRRVRREHIGIESRIASEVANSLSHLLPLRLSTLATHIDIVCPVLEAFRRSRSTELLSCAVLNCNIWTTSTTIIRNSVIGAVASAVSLVLTTAWTIIGWNNWNNGDDGNDRYDDWDTFPFKLLAICIINPAARGCAIWTIPWWWNNRYDWNFWNYWFNRCFTAALLPIEVILPVIIPTPIVRLGWPTTTLWGAWFSSITWGASAVLFHPVPAEISDFVLRYSCIDQIGREDCSWGQNKC